MSDQVPPALRDEMADYSLNDTRKVAGLVQRWPNFRRHIAYAVLGQAVAVADSFGCDVEQFIADLRKRYPKPAVLVPPKGN